MDDLRQQVAALARRVRALEDELAIHRQIVRYGLAVDTGDADGAAAVFTEDTVYDVDGPLLMHGRQGVRDMVRGPRHQAMLPNCAHQIGPAVVTLDGDRATATGYSRVYLRRDTEIAIYRVSFNRWELERQNGEWLIARRTTRLLGHEEALKLFHAGR
jgi:ketosteroid isomerase-like protein